MNVRNAPEKGDRSRVMELTVEPSTCRSVGIGFPIGLGCGDAVAERTLPGQVRHAGRAAIHTRPGMLADANVPEEMIARMMGGNAAAQFGIELLESALG